jgi:hypothetical protein
MADVDLLLRLALSHNPSCILPSEVVRCDRLRYLNLRWNKLDRFPTVVWNIGNMGDMGSHD